MWKWALGAKRKDVGGIGTGRHEGLRKHRQWLFFVRGQLVEAFDDPVSTANLVRQEGVSRALDQQALHASVEGGLNLCQTD